MGVAGDHMVVVLVVLNATLSVYGAWQMVRGWQLQRRGEDRNRLMMAGAARLLLSSALWVSIALSSAWSHRFGPVTGRLAFGVGVALILVSVVVGQRRKQLLRKPQG